MLDVAAQLNETEIVDLKELLSWHSLIKNQGLSLVAAINRTLDEQINLIESASGLINLMTLNWTLDEIHSIAARHLRAATDGVFCELEDLFVPSLVEELGL